jgi:hypothetical protein
VGFSCDAATADNGNRFHIGYLPIVSKNSGIPVASIIHEGGGKVNENGRFSLRFAPKEGEKSRLPRSKWEKTGDLREKRRGILIFS